MKGFSLKTLAGLFLLASCARGATLGLEDYLEQVRATGPNYRQAVINWKTNEVNRMLLAKHWSGSMGVTFGGGGTNNDYNYTYVYQNGINTNPGSYQSFSPQLTENDGLSGGVNFSNSWDFGLNTTLSDNFQSFNTWPMYDNTAGTNLYNNSGDNLSLSAGIPLWQNFLGRDVHAQDQRDFRANDSTRENDDFLVQQTLYNARVAYFTLVVLRDELAAAKEALQNYQDLLGIAQARHSAQDLTQARAAVENEQLALESLGDAERLARDSFNLLRGVTGSAVEENLQSLDELNRQMTAEWDPSDPDRMDLESVRLQLESAHEALVVAEEGTKLDVELGGSINGNLVQNDFGYPAPPPLNFPNLTEYSVGLSVNVPFDLFTPRWGATYRIAKLNVRQQEFNLKETENNDSQQWEDMTIRYEKSSDRIATANRLVEDSRKNRDEGRALLKRGLVDMFEAISFVGAYTNALVVQQNWIAQRLTLLAQADWYRAQPQAWKKRTQPQP
jgi:outer membrane protein TolC